MFSKSLIIFSLLFSSTAFAKEFLWYTENKLNTLEILSQVDGKIKNSFSFLKGTIIVFEAAQEDLLKIVNLNKSSSDIIEENTVVEIMTIGEPQSLEKKAENYHHLQWALENRGDNEPVRLNHRSPVPGVIGADVNALEAWKLNKGSEDIIVAVVDTGVDYQHPNLKDNMWINEAEANGTPGVDDDKNGYIDDIRGWDFIEDDNDPNDEKGHGTHCAGIIGAKHLSQGIKGVAHNVKIMNIKFLDKKGRGTMEQTIKAMEYAVNQKPHIINASWGSSRESEIIKKLIEKAQRQGTYIVAAAGNFRGRNNDVSPTYPATYDYENIISVSAHNAQNYHSAFSTWGPESVHVAAPGTNIVSTFPAGEYKVWSGTSMAAPHVAGALALLLSYTETNETDLRERLMATSVYVEKLEGKNKSAGRLDLLRLLKNEVRSY